MTFTRTLFVALALVLSGSALYAQVDISFVNTGSNAQFTINGVLVTVPCDGAYVVGLFEPTPDPAVLCADAKDFLVAVGTHGKIDLDPHAVEGSRIYLCSRQAGGIPFFPADIKTSLWFRYTPNGDVDRFQCATEAAVYKSEEAIDEWPFTGELKMTLGSPIQFENSHGDEATLDNSQLLSTAD